MVKKNAQTAVKARVRSQSMETLELPGRSGSEAKSDERKSERQSHRSPGLAPQNLAELPRYNSDSSEG